jgi:hypothetical protein
VDALVYLILGLVEQGLELPKITGLKGDVLAKCVHNLISHL